MKVLRRVFGADSFTITEVKDGGYIVYVSTYMKEKAPIRAFSTLGEVLEYLQTKLAAIPAEVPKVPVKGNKKKSKPSIQDDYDDYEEDDDAEYDARLAGYTGEDEKERPAAGEKGQTGQDEINKPVYGR